MSLSNEQFKKMVSSYDADQLEEAITVLDTLYEDGKDCIDPISGEVVPDIVYDYMRQQLHDVRPDSDIFLTPTASEADDSEHMMKHNPPMVSIDKAGGEERSKRMTRYLKECMSGLGYTKAMQQKCNDTDEALFCQSFKRDGVAVAIKYVKGALVQAGLRPRNAIDGADVTPNIAHVQGIPATLPIPIDIEIRGELECSIKEFIAINKALVADGKKKFANTRMFTAGTIKKWKNADPKRLAKINFIGYSVENFHSPDIKTAIQLAKWVNQKLGIPFIRKEPFKGSSLQTMEDMVKELPYEVDGVVIEVNNIEDCEQLGRVNDNPIGNPIGKIAWKFEEQKYKATVDAIRWQTGRTGRITPVLEFPIVMIDGTEVTNCTAHNVGIVENLGLGKGAEIEIIKAGKIIPKIAGVIRKSDKVSRPINCSVCGEALVYSTSDKTVKKVKTKVADLTCPNKATCPAQNIQSLKKYLDAFGCKGLGESKIEKLVSSGLVKCPADFYQMTVEDVIAAGLTERLAVLAVATVWKVAKADQEKCNITLIDKIEVKKTKKQIVSMGHFIASLGIPGADKGTGRRLAETFTTLDEVRNATFDDLIAITDIGDITATSIIDFFSKNGDNIDRLMKYVEIEAPKTGVLSGKSFVFTGGFPGSKKTWIALVEDNGGKVGSSVSKKTDYVVIGTDAGSKEAKARKLNADTGKPELIEDVEDLKKMVE